MSCQNVVDLVHHFSWICRKLFISCGFIATTTNQIELREVWIINVAVLSSFNSVVDRFGLWINHFNVRGSSNHFTQQRRDTRSEKFNHF